MHIPRAHRTRTARAPRTHDACTNTCANACTTHAPRTPQVVIWLHARETAPPMLRLQVQHPIVSVAKNLVGVTDVKIDVAEMRAHGDTRLPGAVEAGLPPLWMQILGPVLPSCAEAAQARGDTPGTFALHPAASLADLDEEVVTPGTRRRKDKQNPVKITVRTGRTVSEEVVIVAGQQGIVLLPAPALSLADFWGRAVVHMLALVQERKRGGVSRHGQHVRVEASCVQLCVPQPTDHRAPRPTRGPAEGLEEESVDPFEVAFDKMGPQRTSDASGGGHTEKKESRSRPPSLLEPRADDGVLLSLPMSGNAARARRPRLLAMHFQTTIEIMKHGGDAAGVEQVVLALSHLHTCLPVGHFDVRPVPLTELRTPPTHPGRAEGTLAALSVLPGRADALPSMLERMTLYLDVTKRPGQQRISVAPPHRSPCHHRRTEPLATTAAPIPCHHCRTDPLATTACTDRLPAASPPHRPPPTAPSLPRTTPHCRWRSRTRCASRSRCSSSRCCTASASNGRSQWA